MAVPNTTPTPNELYNGEMKKMKDTELRVVLVVTRQTLGWIKDDDSGRRKEKDWISHQQLIDKTGRSGRAVSNAIESCIQNGWIEARNGDGEILDSPKKRSGNKIYYRLGEIFLEKTVNKEEKETPEESSEDDETSEDFSKTSEDSTTEDSSGYKRNPITKETNTKDSGASSDFPLEEKLEEMSNDKRHIQIIGIWIEERGLQPKNEKQYQRIIKRYLRPAKRLEGYSDEEIRKTIDYLGNVDHIDKPSLETVEKYIDDLIAGNLKGRKSKTYEY